MSKGLRTGQMWVVLLLCAAACLGAGSRARAEGVDPARSASARALFEEGIAHADREQWAPAADAFRRALALRDSQVIRHNLASALIELGKLVEASELLHAVQADALADGALREDAASKLSEIKPRIARLSIHPQAVLPSLVVELDGIVLSVAQLDVPLTVDPGSHVVKARVAEEPLDEQSVQLVDGGSAVVTLRAPTPAPQALASALVPLAVPPVTPEITARDTARLAEPAPVPSPSAPLRDEPTTPSRKKLWWGIGVGGVGLAAFATLMILFVPRQQRSHDTTDGNFDPPSVNVRVPQ